MIRIERFRFNIYREFTYLVWDTDTKDTLIVDPGCSCQTEFYLIKTFIAENKLKPSKIVNTHCHIDHIIGNSFVKKAYNIPIFIHEKEMKSYNAAPKFFQDYGFKEYEHIAYDEILDNEITVGTIKFEIWSLPGHSFNHIVLINKDLKICISGDILFKKHIGKISFRLGGNKNKMINSLQTLMTLNDDVIVYPGHGPLTTIGEERENVQKIIQNSLKSME